MDRKIEMYHGCPEKIDGGEAMIAYLQEHRSLLAGRPQCFQHGDYHVGNLMLENGRLVVIDGGFCRAYHEKTGIAGYTLVYSSRTMSLRTHQPFESAEKAVKDNLDIISQKNILETENHRILVEDTDEGEVLRERVHDLKQLVAAYQLGWITETRCEDHIW